MLCRSCIGIVALLLLGSFASAQVPDDLANKKDFKAFRASSTSPTGKNDDARPIEPGQTITLADVQGSGRFTHLWMTIAAQSGAEALRELVIRMTWDDAATPAVECPVGDFFAQGPGKYVEFRSAPVSVGGQMALNCYWPMPFKKHAVITMTNEGSKRVDAYYWNFDYRLDSRPERDLRYFHTQYRNYFPAPKGVPLTICDVKGAGHFVGTVVTVLANSDGWWGEGDDIWYVDGSPKPVIFGTGSEDYFCGAWDFGHTFQTPYFGVTYYDNPDKGGEKRGIQNTVYRWHIQDPVPFTKTLLFQLEHGRGGWDEDRNPLRNHYTTLGLYYVDHAEGDIPPIPPYKDRVPHPLDLPGK
ncbi:MAG TPA: glycoside hydrolase family 172 protein [Fimbriimonadaceae bacterium]|nr:glycoside hydrolase family 172 protein [Fimbriimonadaceae bacterium]